MFKTLLICTALVAPVMATPALAQMQNTAGMQNTEGMQNTAGMQHTKGMNSGGMAAKHGATGDTMQGMKHGAMMEKMQSMMGKMMMQQMMGQMMMSRMGAMNHGAKMGNNSGMSGAMGTANPTPQGVGGSPVSEPGQSAFAAIAEVVNVLKADPNTDWSKVNIDALRDHLRDMDIVTIDSATVSTEVDGGMRFDVTGSGDVADAIRRMATAHAGMMDGVDGWTYSTAEIAGGEAMTVIVPKADLAKLKGLGFYGVMASGMHHQPHHWAMATGGSPHG